METLPVIILAAGRAQRMRGADKLLEPVAGEPLLRRQARLARALTSGPVIVALPAPPHPRHEVLAGIDVTRLGVTDAGEGMNASLRAGFAALPEGCAAAMLLLADLPELTLHDLRKVARAVDLNSDSLIWRGATEAGQGGHPIIFAAPVFSQIAQLKGDSGAREVVAQAANRVVLVPLPGERARRDLDTPEDWAAWRCRMRDA
ncbi:NTP transferase domain-containing protein [Sulfitobacter aestuarii]|uniref:NTP transferase domain-containing protein n=1 Tax=Sulfitobacter aestuarii TaxID=2161676 RepID=A0ABW5U0H6_9RHOB